jgi:hypothetical protein
MQLPLVYKESRLISDAFTQWSAYSVYAIDIVLDIMFTVCMTFLLHKEKYAFQRWFI